MGTVNISRNCVCHGICLADSFQMPADCRGKVWLPFDASHVRTWTYRPGPENTFTFEKGNGILKSGEVSNTQTESRTFAPVLWNWKICPIMIYWSLKHFLPNSQSLNYPTVVRWLSGKDKTQSLITRLVSLGRKTGSIAQKLTERLFR